MPEYLAPGVYVEEVSSGNKPIAGVSTSTAGFVGGTERGPLAPQFVSSWIEFQRVYGTYVPDQSYLAYAVEGFFNNGGVRCFVARIAPPSAISATVDLTTEGKELTLEAIGPGDWGNRLRVTVAKSSLAEMILPTDPQDVQDTKGKLVKVIIELADAKDPNKVEKLEVFDDLTHETGSGRNVLKTINAGSQLVRAFWVDPTDIGPLALADQSPLMLGSDGGGIEVDHFKGNPDQVKTGTDLFGRSTGLEGLALIDEISLLIAPDEVKYRTNLTDLVIGQCVTLKDRFAITSSVDGQNKINILRPPTDTSYAAFYYPWIKVYDPSIDHYRIVPPSGHVAGIYARTDIERGVHKAPANEVVRGAVDLEFPVTKAMQDMLNPRGVNCFRDFRSDGRGLRLWGARTMSSDPEWRYVNVRRLFLFVEESIEEGTQWVVFEPNDESTWASVRRNLTSFLIGVWRSGALMGLTQDEAFFVACDRTTMTQDDIDNGRLVFVIGIAPVKPAEFVIFRISQKTAEVAA